MKGKTDLMRRTRSLDSSWRFLKADSTKLYDWVSFFRLSHCGIFVTVRLLATPTKPTQTNSCKFTSSICVLKNKDYHKCIDFAVCSFLRSLACRSLLLTPWFSFVGLGWSICTVKLNSDNALLGKLNSSRCSVNFRINHLRWFTAVSSSYTLIG